MLYKVRMHITCADPGIFVRCGGGVQVNLTKKALTTFFFCLFFFVLFFSVLSLFYRSQMVNFKENYHFSRFQGGPTFSRGGGGGVGVQLLIPYRNPYILWFSRGGGPDPLFPPLDPHLYNNNLSNLLFN